MKVVSGSPPVSLAKAVARDLFAGSVDVVSERDPCGFSDGERYLRLLGSVTGDLSSSSREPVLPRVLSNSPRGMT